MYLRESIISQTDVSFMLAKHVFSKEVNGDTNLVLSPLSIQIVLGLIAAGSNGPNQDQLLCFLKTKSIDDLNSLYSHIVSVVFADGSPNGGPRLSVANGIWIEQTLPLKPSFKQVVDNVYKAASESVDFQNKAGEVADQVNQWTRTKTNDLIQEILSRDAVNNMTRLILANTLYFKGEWNEKFDTSETKDHEFHLLNGGSIRAPFMTSKKKSAHDGLPALFDKISTQPEFLNQHVPLKKVSVSKFLIPKFKITFGFEASNVLKGLGLTLPFCDGGLIEMVDSPSPEKLCVSQIFHKSIIEVNEEGMEAAATTGFVGIMVSYKIEKPSVLVPYKR